MPCRLSILAQTVFVSVPLLSSQIVLNLLEQQLDHIAGTLGTVMDQMCETHYINTQITEPI